MSTCPLRPGKKGTAGAGLAKAVGSCELASATRTGVGGGSEGVLGVRAAPDRLVDLDTLATSASMSRRSPDA